MSLEDADEAAHARCQAVVDRVLTGTVDVTELNAFVAGVAGLVPCDPERSRLAVTMVLALTRSGMSGPVGLLPQLGKLLELVDHVPSSLTIWPQVRASVRARCLAYAATYGELTDLAAADRELVELADVVRDVPGTKVLVDGARMIVDAASGFRAGEASPLYAMTSYLLSMLHQLGDHPVASVIRSASETLRQLYVAGRAGGPDDTIQLLDQLGAIFAELPVGADEQDLFVKVRFPLDVFMKATGGAALDGKLDPVLELMTAAGSGPTASAADRIGGMIAAVAGIAGIWETTDLDQIDVAIERCRGGLADQDAEHLPFVLVSLALGLFRRSDVLGTTEGLDEAEAVLVRALDLMENQQHRFWSLANDLLSSVRLRTGDFAAPGKFGMAAQRSYVWRVLLETELAGARIAIRDAVDGAVGLARRCLAANNIEDALRALDTCRGLMLFAEVQLRNVPAHLSAVGRVDLADRWVSEGRDSLGLRREVMTALMNADSSRGILDPPGLREIRKALAVGQSDALVYLVPGEDIFPGLAVIAPAEGRPACMSLPNLVVAHDAQVEKYLTALARRSDESRPREVAAEGGTFEDNVDSMCDWAWRAAIGPLLDRYFARTVQGGRVPRIVLVPMGDLARIPWSAARRPDGTYAVQLAAFSHAVSARLFCDGMARPPVKPTSTGLIVGDPAADRAELLAARLEAHAIRQTFYRGARYIGRRPDGSDSPSGRGTVAEARDWLADTSPHAGTVLHLACHGSFTSGADDVRAALLLAPLLSGPATSGELSAEEIVRVLHAVPERRLGLVVMAACHTGRSIHGYDEAYSLGTAFLAGGARTVLWTQWAIPDKETSALMFMFHHYLRAENLAPWEALRRAQMWMLDDSQEPPDSMPADLRSLIQGRGRAHVVAWAGFVHGGH